MGSIAVSTSFYCKNYGHISVLISAYEAFFPICPTIEVVNFPICIELGERRSDSLLPSYARLPGAERSVNTVFPPPKKIVCALERKEEELVKMASTADNFCSQGCKMPHVINCVSVSFTCSGPLFAVRYR